MNYQVYSYPVTMARESKLIDRCPMQGVIDIVSKKWALLIVTALGNRGTMRYNGLLRELQGISPKTLADSLKALQEYHIISRASFNEIPPRVEYSLTPDGRALRQSVLPLIRWALERTDHKDCVILRSASMEREA